MRKGMILFGLWLLMGPAAALRAQESKQYRLLATTLTSTMQKELNQAAAQGYRVVAAGPTRGNEMVVIVEKVTDSPDTYEYLLLATQRTSTIQKELSDASAQGFRLVPKALLMKRRALAEDEITLVMEKPSGPPKYYFYKILATKLTLTLEKEIGKATAEGFTVVSMMSRDEHIIILEKAAQ